MAEGKKISLEGIQKFSCPFIGLVPYMRQLTESEIKKSIEVIQLQIQAGNEQYKQFLDQQGNIKPEAIQTVMQEFKPFPCCTTQKGETLRCRFYVPKSEFYENEEGWECSISLNYHTGILKNLSDIERNEVEIETLQLQIDELVVRRRELGLPPVEEDDDEDGDEDQDEDEDDKKDDDGDSLVEV